MYILVNSENVIVGCAINPVNEEDCSKKGTRVFKVPKDEFSYDMIGKKLDSFEEDNGI